MAGAIDLLYGNKGNTGMGVEADKRVTDRADANGSKVVGMPTAPARRRDPMRPGHFLDEQPSMVQHIKDNPGAVMGDERSTTADRRFDSKAGVSALGPASRQGPYARLGAGGSATTKAPSQDAFLSTGAASALENFIGAIVDARLSARMGGADKGAEGRLSAARDEFAANFVKR